MFRKILIANRGEIACRIIRTCKRLGVATVAVYSDVDRNARHVLDADEAAPLGGAAPAESYLRTEAVLEAAQAHGAEAIHPGYGFLSENARFAELCAQAGLEFVGPTAEQMREFGLKHSARRLARESNVPLLPGTELLRDAEEAVLQAGAVGYPVMLKSTAGGGGIGMRLCRNDEELRREFETVQSLGRNNFADDGVFLEKYIERARHVEVQLFGDGQGRVLAAGDRDCSVQRRNQKVIEEAPAPGIPAETRRALHEAAVRLGKAVRYRSAGTVEFVYEESAQSFYFLEVNTRLQVEHGVTENVFGMDLVEWMLRLAADDRQFINQIFQNPPGEPRGHSIETRIYAEDPFKNFQPSVGLLDHVSFPGTELARIDGWIENGTEISPSYDPLLAKIMATGADRAEALARMQQALESTELYGIETNLEYLRGILGRADFRAGQVWTRMLEGFACPSHAVEVLAAGVQTSVQDYPGRLGYWDVGVPPSGPMDALALRLGNALLGNAERAPGLEMTVQGATLRFRSAATVCLTGARMQARWSPPEDPGDVREAPYWRTLRLPAGATLKIGTIAADSGGYRTYLCVRGGFDVPEMLGSRSTFALGQFGGHAGRTLRPGDVLRLALLESAGGAAPAIERTLTFDEIPEYPRGSDAVWEIGALYGPHGAPDFFTEEFIETFFTTDWEVHYNSARTGVRLIGPKPGWARSDGGEAGLHPSNIHDCAYVVGAVDFTGDMPILLGPDGPSLGGFVCPATIVRAELWKMGQLRPGDRVRFVRISREDAEARDAELERRLNALAAGAAPAHETSRTQSPGHATQPSPEPIWRSSPTPRSFASMPSDAVRFALPAGEHPTGVVCRQSGDEALLVEYGPMELDLRLRCRVQALMEWFRERSAELAGIRNLTPGIRSLQIQFDNRMVSPERIVSAVQTAERELGEVHSLEVPARIVHMPLSWDDESTRIAIDKYMRSVWREAPWCPSNIEFIRRINGLESAEDVRRILFEASYLVMGLGDVYLGAPVATPVDPRHRLVTTKYNPARTWTPENAVGIGGAYLCVYGMEGPGGYQFVGRTCQVWNTHRTTEQFVSGKPYLLRFFDQIRFYPAEAEELAEFRRGFLHGRVSLRMEEETFRLSDYEAFLRANAESIAEFKRKQQQAFDQERERWKSLPPPQQAERADAADAPESEALPDYAAAVASPLQGTVWKILVQPGDPVRIGQDLLILEAMKMEIVVQAAESGVVERILCETGASVAPGQNLAVLDLRGEGVRVD